MRQSLILTFFFFNDTATTEIYTLSLHDALPISKLIASRNDSSVGSTRTRSYTVNFTPAASRELRTTFPVVSFPTTGSITTSAFLDRKSTRLNSSHTVISYAVFCLKKNKNKDQLSEQNALAFTIHQAQFQARLFPSNPVLAMRISNAISRPITADVQNTERTTIARI